MIKAHRAVRGMRDILPDESDRWQHLEQIIAQTMASFACKQIRLPVLESTALFCRSIGEQTDIIGKEMYTFEDRNGDSLSLRPEGTASCLRAGIEHGLFYNQRQKLWYQGPMFRHERPQQGRYRQFEQWGVEAIGYPGVEIEAELLYMTWALWNKLGISNNLKLEINSLGDSEARARFRATLLAYFDPFLSEMTDAECQRLHENPLRILDSKNPKLAPLIAGAPRIEDALSNESCDRFKQLQSLLKQWGVPFQINPHLVRGLDYYQDTVFEWVATDALGAQNTVCAGGRYDGLVASLGGSESSAFGFAAGLDRLLLMPLVLPQNQKNIAVIVENEACYQLAHRHIIDWRQRIDGHMALAVDSPHASLKSQRKRTQQENAYVTIQVDKMSLEKGSFLVYHQEHTERYMPDALLDLLTRLKEAG